MTLNKAMTYGSIAFALFALVYITRSRPSGRVATQPGQAQRDAGLFQWNNLQAAQQGMGDDSFRFYAVDLERKLGS